MALRINNAKDFKGKFYLTEAALDTIIKGFSFSAANNTLTLQAGTQSSSVVLDGLVKVSANTQFIAVDSANTLNDAALETFLGTTGGSATASKIVTTDENGKLEYTLAKSTEIPAAASDATDSDIPTVKAVKTYVDEHGISLTSTDSSVTITNPSGVTQNLATNLYIKKLGTADTGYAATYQLQIGNGAGASAIGDKIQILKDQFLKDAAFVSAATADDVTTAGGANAGFSAGDPVIKFTMELTGTDSDTDSYLYVPVKSLVDVYNPGNGIDITSNVVSVKIENTTSGYTVFTSAGSSTTLIESTNGGVKVANIGAAISTAVRDEHAKMSAAVNAVDTNVKNLQSATSSAISTLDSNVDTLQANTSAAVGGLASDINALDSKTSGAIASVNTNLSNAVSSAMANVSSAVTTHTANAVQMKEAEVTPVAGSGDSSATYTATQTANNIVAVYDPNGIQIYPEISRTGNKPYTYTLKADYGTVQSTVEKWTVLYTVDLEDYSATAVTTGSATYATNEVTAGDISATATVTAPDAPSTVTVSDLTYDTVNNG